MRKINISSKYTVFDSEAFGLYLNDISKLPLLTPMQEQECAEKAAAGDKVAEDLLISCNLRFVISVAKIYVDDHCKLEDLVNEGNEGLIHAARRFNPDKGYKFISYAVWWIRRNIVEFKNNHSRIIRVPSNKINLVNKLKEETNKFEVEFNREPSDIEIFEIFNGDINEDKLREIFEITHTSVKSLDFEIDADGTSFQDVLADTTGKDTDHLLCDSDKTLQISNMLDVLNPTQRRVMVLSYGLDGDHPMTLNEIGCELGVSRERIRQLKDECLGILKFSARKNGWAMNYQK